MAPHITGRDVRDHSLTLRDLAELPWRETGTRDADGRVTQCRASGNVVGIPMTITQDLTYYPNTDPTAPGCLASELFTMQGPTTGAATTLELIPLYNSDMEWNGQDVKIDGTLVAYV